MPKRKVGRPKKTTKRITKRKVVKRRKPVHKVIRDEGRKVRVRAIKGNTYKGDRIARGNWSAKKWKRAQASDKARYGKYEKWERKSKTSKPYKKRKKPATRRKRFGLF